MFTLSKFEWLVLALALALCPGWSWGAEPADSLFAGKAKTRDWIAVDRDGDGIVAAPAPNAEPNAAAGSSKQPEKE